jgi:hypothetical protein
MLYPIAKPKPESSEDLIGYINSSGHIVVTLQYKMGRHYSEGVAAVMRADGQWVFIDEQGRISIPRSFEGIYSFREGLCPAYVKSATGYVDRTGKWFIQPSFSVASQFNEGLAYVSVDGQSFGFIDRSGQFVIKPQFTEARRFSCGLAAVRKEGFWGYVDRMGCVRIPFQFDGPRAQPFTNGLAGVCSRGEWGFIDTSGGWVVKPQYEGIGRFSEGYAPVCLEGGWRFLDLAGNLHSASHYDSLGELDCGLATAAISGSAGFVAASGDWVIPPNFEECFRFVGELAAVRGGNSWQYIKRDGQVVWRSEPFAMVQAPPYIE